MAIETPGYASRHAALAALSSRYVQVDELPWQSTRFPGIQIKVLMEDTATGLQTVLTRMAPGSILTDHEHVELEQSWVLEGRLVDHEGEVKAGNYVWRPAGSRQAPRRAPWCWVFSSSPTIFSDSNDKTSLGN
jgi:anti-sigma factor ChrR (cupin superfamily)